MAIITGAIIAGGAAIIGGGIQANAASRAAGQQVDAAGRATGVTQAQQARTRADLEPFLRTGVAANQTLANYMGIGGAADGSGPLTAQQVSQIYQRYMGRPVQAQEMQSLLSSGQTAAQLEQAVSQSPEHGVHVNFQQNVSPVTAPLFSATPGAGQDANTGTLLKQFTGESVATDPGYQFGMKQGELGLQRRASASGLRLSPATQKALDRFNQDYAGTKFNEAFQRDMTQKQFTYNTLAGVSDQGRGAGNTVGVLGEKTAGQVGENIMGAGNASAAGTVGTGNAISGAVQGAGNQFMNYAVLDRYLKGSGSGGVPANSPYLP